MCSKARRESYDFDVIVVGAGPAGSAAARQLAVNGWRVALLEKAGFPGQENACGGMLSLSTIVRLELPLEVIEKKMTSENHIMPWGVYKNKTGQCTVQRRVFDQLLSQRATEAGAELMSDTVARNVRIVKAGSVEVMIMKRASSQSTVLRGRGVIYADGPNTLARSQGLGCKLTHRTTAVALAYELAWPGNEMDHYRMYYGTTIGRWGYAWIFPYRDVLNVGIGFILSEVRKRRDLHHALSEFINKHPHASPLLSGRQIIWKRGGMIPLRTAQKMAGTSTLIAGDAAGLVHPLVGAGIDNALASGELAGNVMSSALAAENLSREFLSKYEYEWKKTPTHRSMQRQHIAAMVGQALSRVDQNALAKIIQFFMGGKLTSIGHLKVLAYPLLGMPSQLESIQQ